MSEAKLWRATELRGEIKSQRALLFSDLRALQDDLIQVILDEEDILQMLEDGVIDEKEATKIRNFGEVDDLITDGEGDIVEVETSKGTFLLISQNMDGHGHLTIVEEA